MDLYFTTPVGPFGTVLGSAKSNFTTRQDIALSTNVPLPVINGYQLRQGSKVIFMAEGEFSTTGTPTLSIGCYIGTIAAAITTVLAESAAITTGSAAAAWPWRLEYRGIITAVGTSGSITGCGGLELGTSLTAVSENPIPTTAAARTVTWDTTIPRAVGVCATWGTASASNTITVYNSTLLIAN